VATVAGLLIFCGAMGKSAQFPLHVWLPDAMEGPTPVSALIHAATMVAAGVYMLCRVIFLLNAPALEMISWVGGATALLAALIAVQQDDIKRILAYSTLSQLGYMVLGVGLGGPKEAMFHLTTHAFFKALLFLGAGSVIVALHHEQNIWKMGALRKKMPATYWTFLVGTLALAGAPLFSGFYSKDAILAKAAEHHAYGRFALAVVVAILTAFYMFRLVFVVFGGSARSDAASHGHESPPVMVIPLRILAVLSVIGGYIGVESLYGRQFSTGTAAHSASILQQMVLPFTHAPLAATAGVVAAALGFFAAYSLYAKAAKDPLPAKLGVLSVWMRDRFYFDELYEAVFICLHDFVAAVAGWIDRWIISGLMVRGAHGTTEILGRLLRELQTGNLQTYAFLFALGVAFVLFLALK
jgi:NADH-quinone oxidoreductase subunit L